MSLHVIVTAFNPDPALLERAVASALFCDGVERVSIVDDGSAVPVKCPVSDKRVEIVHRQNGGPSAARNTGLDLVRSDHAMMLDDDDELIAEGVAEALSLATRLGAVGALVGRIEARHDGSVCSRLAPAEWAGKSMPRPGDAFRPIQIFNASGTLISRHAIDLGLRYEETLWVVEDREFIRRLAEVGPIAITQGAAVRSGVRPGGVRLTSAANLVKRAKGHASMMSKWLDAESEPHFRDATLWLLNAMSKSGLSRDATFVALYAEALERGWIGPLRRLKLRRRALFRRPSA
ncbi:MAG: glycosyltransferase family 2 protein [Phycisphaeraceae bacterium]|nr:glycosyltransferase family 2 protein [Phycisphaeraceae bacterium]MCW5767725.1 glycosyltransferase family 2 protein [Phycisphaeraceae bacterium]